MSEVTATRMRVMFADNRTRPRYRITRIAVAGLLGAASVTATVAAAERDAGLPRVGIIELGSADRPRPRTKLLQAALRDLGQIEGKTFVFERRWWNWGKRDAPALIASLMQSKIDVFVALGPIIRWAKTVTQIPVVFATSVDPVAAGLVRSLGRPGGNMTGVTYMSFEVNGKRLELIKEAFPHISRVAILSNPAHGGEPLEIAASRLAAKTLGLHINYFPVRTGADTTAALAAIRAARDQAIIGIPDGGLRRHGATIGAFATRERIPLVYGWGDWARWGALMTFGPDLDDSRRGVARYVDKILRGAKPADLPVERPSRFELVVNLKTAKALGITLPSSILLRADRVIE